MQRTLMSTLGKMLEGWSRPPVVSFLVFVVVLSAIAFSWLGNRYIPDTPDVHPGYTAGKAFDILDTLEPGQRGWYAAMEWLVDIPFAVAYSVLTAMMLLAVGEPGRRFWWVPLAGGLCDVVENITLGVLALLHPAWKPLFWVAAMPALVKWIAPVLALVLVLAGWLKNRNHGWLVTGFFWLVIGLAVKSVIGPIGVVLWLLVAMAVVHWKLLYLAQYVFFLRIPIVMGLALCFLPQLAGRSSFLGNLLTLESDLHVVWVSFLGTIVALTVMAASRLVYLTTPLHTNLALPRLSENDWAKRMAQRAGLTKEPGVEHHPREPLVMANRAFLLNLAPWLVHARVFVFGLLAGPLLEGIRHTSPDAPMWALLGGWLVATVVVFGATRWLMPGVREWIDDWLERRPRISTSGPAILLLDASQPDKVLEGFRVRGHGSVAFVGFIAVFLYVVNSPWVMGVSDSLKMAAVGVFPPVFYLFLIFIVVTWLGALATLLLDRSRIPLLLAVGVVLALLFAASKGDRFYEVVPGPAVWSELPGPQAVVRARLENRQREMGTDEERKVEHLTVVAASGGGITASYWTVRVLQELANEIGQSLMSSVAVVSSNSGGSVGSMYFTDAFQPGELTSDALENAVTAAGHSSLAAAVWGMAYPDLRRLVTGGFFPRGSSRIIDRGWALSRCWQEVEGSSLRGSRYLGDWIPGVVEGWRPAHIFNATVVETGGAMRMATVKLSNGEEMPWDPGSMSREFDLLYPDADIAVATAARLSASFPWVSPMARPWMKPAKAAGTVWRTAELADNQPEDHERILRSIEDAAFHLVDGGYFDNFGVYSAIDFLYKARPALSDGAVNRVAFLQIRAAPEQSAEAKRGGLTYSTVGPLMVMNKVRTSSQIGRNDSELILLREILLKQNIELCPFVFTLDKEDAPLSWHLSSEERAQIDKAWEGEPEATAGQLKEFLSDPDFACPTKLELPEKEPPTDDEGADAS